MIFMQCIKQSGFEGPGGLGGREGADKQSTKVIRKRKVVLVYGSRFGPELWSASVTPIPDTSQTSLTYDWDVCYIPMGGACDTNLWHVHIFQPKRGTCLQRITSHDAKSTCLYRAKDVM